MSKKAHETESSALIELTALIAYQNMASKPFNVSTIFPARNVAVAIDSIRGMPVDEAAAADSTVRNGRNYATRHVTAPLMEPLSLERCVMTDFWKVHAFSLATTLGVAYISCAIFDVLFPPFGLLAALAPASPWPISGSPLAFLTGFALFTVAGFVLGALYGIAWGFWSKRPR